MSNVNPFDVMTSLTMHNQKDIDEHILTLFALTISMKPANIFELGVRTARSSLPFLFASQIVGSKVTSVDVEQPVPDFAFPEEWKDKWTFKQKDALKFLKDDLPQMKSVYTSQHLYDSSPRCDIFYVDDWHSYEHVVEELRLIGQYATPKDLIILHDLMYGNSQPHYKSVESPRDPQWGGGGPYKAIAELDLNEWEYMTIPRCNGLTLLRKKSPLVVDKD